MAVSRRLRFEILRRDAYTCRYCGAKAPDVPLTVDHVVPEALGGGNEPQNLVTACQPCNSGKASIAPDAALVDDVDATAMLFARAAEQVAAIRLAQLDELQQLLSWFAQRWADLLGGMRADYLPDDWASTIERFLGYGLRRAELEHFMYVTASRRLPWDGRFRYFCGCCWNEISTRQELARRLIEDGEV